ncbi:TonB-dependent receptor domain-containing protein [Wenyingzhuangia sp. 2_MG-2023]|uniref:TonB-dependent receptor n=1 Tax=Wenyingzhuangia sp. 2_MG-2023 TaxID=3062639 RepID=UPI0026E3032F|nr:TonB-dependent receptor [Wenyingzhuangia sp. 2_MG-2023]MDO6736622.1 TonB-dependent receptor [Wenyingzhuangia sp. 2_MG-2023]
MKKLILFTLVFTSLILKSFGQESKTITGLVIDGFGQPIPLASVKILNTSKGVFTNFNGEFEINTTTNSDKLEISSLGFTTKVVTTDSTKQMKIVMESSSVGLDEIMIVASATIDRKTPVATSKITKADIELKLGNQEFVEILKTTPGVYTSKAGGGFGDGEITMRGFNSENVGVLINGVPVNDMENGRVYWSNWAGIGAVTSSTQTQRGLGASKVAIPSIGGTVNIITETTDAEEGGFFSYGLGNDGYNKYGLKYSTGLMDNGLAVTVYADRTNGNGYVDGTEFNGVSYFTNISYKINNAHKLSFTVIGAQQRHGQRQTKSTIADNVNNERGIKYNPDWGYKNGQVTHIEDNFYNKPQISLNHYWTINETNKLTTTAYVSAGSGGGGGTAGDESGKFTSPDYKLGNYGPVDLDRIVQENISSGVNGGTAILRASRNDHFWAGALSTLTTELNENVTWVNGVDLRTYTGKHYQEVTDLLGAQYYLNDDDDNNPNNAAQVGDKIAYYNDGVVNWGGLLSQIEYNKDKISAFVTGNLSMTSYKRIEYFQETPGNQETDFVNFLGYGLKGGANYRLDDYHNVFVNAGYFERAPDFDAVWPGYDNNTNEDAKNEKIYSYELGYGLRTEKLAANVNLYHTRWNDRTEVESFQQADKTTAYANITGVNAVHQGIEVDFEYRPFENLKVTGMVSLGDWFWDSNVENVDIINEDQEVVETVSLFVKGTPVGRSAQTTGALGFNYSMAENTTLAVDYIYYDRYFADFDPSNRGSAGLPQPWEIPSVGLFDAVLSHKFKIKDLDTKITARMNNVFNTEYVSVADDNDGTAAGAEVWYGAGRTFSISTKINF